MATAIYIAACMIAEQEPINALFVGFVLFDFALLGAVAT